MPRIFCCPGLVSLFCGAIFVAPNMGCGESQPVVPEKPETVRFDGVYIHTGEKNENGAYDHNFLRFTPEGRVFAAQSGNMLKSEEAANRTGAGMLSNTGIQSKQGSGNWNVNVNNLKLDIRWTERGHWKDGKVHGQFILSDTDPVMEIATTYEGKIRDGKLHLNWHNTQFNNQGHYVYEFVPVEFK